jgi:hypothetical protein
MTSDRIRALEQEVTMLRLAFCDEAYILAVQTLDVKALGKGRRRILHAQAVRMLKVGLNEGLPRPAWDTRLTSRAREKLAELEKYDAATLYDRRLPDRLDKNTTTRSGQS